ncbi:MAG: hypothetical protein QF921_05105 [Pseudomonadales bacterium]|nr:hypothetical protein [Pseudomonadales bacterium]MDP6471889.1 hypothetical protein [Pseudomonadales bacterium]MDP6826841.1 hypothetical protein [Pseudomonadales bacterium]MDP6970881.1 hypothetical protein [Pseudomonadales bacterium]
MPGDRNVVVHHILVGSTESEDLSKDQEGVFENYIIGFMDQDMDGKPVWSELPPNLKKRLVQGFKGVDTNGDGGLDAREFVAMQRCAAEARRQRRPERADRRSRAWGTQRVPPPPSLPP